MKPDTARSHATERTAAAGKRRRISAGLIALAAAAVMVAGSVASADASSATPAGTTERASVAGGGWQANGVSSHPSVSADGRYVAFASAASNLVPGDTNVHQDVFVRDRVAGTIQRISVGPGGIEGDGDSSAPAISADGRYVAFASYATNLVSGDSNAKLDVFMRDRVAGKTVRVSVTAAGAQGYGASSDPAISANGRYIAFLSDTGDLVAGDTNGAIDVFVRDQVAHTTQRMSVASSGEQAITASVDEPSISADGRYVAFASFASNLVPDDTNARCDVFVRDRLASVTERVSLGPARAQANDAGRRPSISADGRYVAFDSLASNLVPADTNARYDVFVRDRVLATTARVSVDSAGVQGNADSLRPSISADGRFIAFDSFTNNLVPADSNGYNDVFVRDCAGGTTTRMSVASAGSQADGESDDAAISANGRYIGFVSRGANLVPADTNASADIFVHDQRSIPSAITITRSTSAVTLPRPFILQGVLTPGRIGDPCVCEVKKPGSSRWSYSSARLVYALAAGGGGKWWYRYTPRLRGLYYFRAHYFGDALRIASLSSSTVSVRVR